MSQPLVYVDESQVEAGKLALLKVAIKELADFVEANEPELASCTATASSARRFATAAGRRSVVRIRAACSRPRASPPRRCHPAKAALRPLTSLRRWH